MLLKRISRQSWFRLRADGRILDIDPALFRSMEEPGDMAEKPDIILLTHSHWDHCEPETIAKLRGERTLILGPESCREKVEGMRIVKPGDETKQDGIVIRAVHAYNTPEGRSTQKLHKKGECLGYVITAEGRSVYHAGDTDLIPEMGSLGKIDAALLPIGGTYTMDAPEAARAAETINPGRIIPMHQLETDPQNLRNHTSLKDRVLIMEPGDEAEV